MVVGGRRYGNRSSPKFCACRLKNGNSMRASSEKPSTKEKKAGRIRDSFESNRSRTDSTSRARNGDASSLKESVAVRQRWGRSEASEAPSASYIRVPTWPFSYCCLPQEVINRHYFIPNHVEESSTSVCFGWTPGLVHGALSPADYGSSRGRARLGRTCYQRGAPICSFRRHGIPGQTHVQSTRYEIE